MAMANPLNDVKADRLARELFGGALWGANAVNGVINIITKTSNESQGTQLVIGSETLGYLIRVVPVSQKYSLFGTFLQDEIRLTDNLSFTAGAKLEHNAFSGFGYEPNLRLAWSNTSRSTFWAAASQSLRQPSVRETALRLQTAPITAIPQIAIDSSVSLDQLTNQLQTIYPEAPRPSGLCNQPGDHVPSIVRRLQSRFALLIAFPIFCD